MADPYQRWKKIGELGRGGQGVVHQVLDRNVFDWNSLYETIEEARGVTISTREERLEHLESFTEAISEFHRMEDPRHQGALKELHQPEDARDADRAGDRIAREIEAMSRVSHPHLLRILDSDPQSKWFVSEYHPRGSLGGTRRYEGNFVRALRAFRGLVDGVGTLHQRGIVHRDIKPQNVFIASDGRLVLGDFGIVFFEDEERTRLSGALENVGSRDYMPMWAQGMLIEEVRATFDVFSLGKLLWAMVAGPDRKLQAWYFSRPESDLRRVFPQAQFIELLNPLLAKCVVENEEDCLPNAGDLLVEVDELLSLIETGSELCGSSPGGHGCKVCGLGTYDSVDAVSIGVSSWLSAFVCNNCGNIELFQRWEIQAYKPQHWKRNDAGTITGLMQGQVLHRLQIPRTCTLDVNSQRGGPHLLDHLAAFLRWTPQ